MGGGGASAQEGGASHITSSTAPMKNAAFFHEGSPSTLPSQEATALSFIPLFMSHGAERVWSALKGKSIDPMGGKIQTERWWWWWWWAGEHCGDQCSMSYQQSAPLSAGQPAMTHTHTHTSIKTFNATLISTPFFPLIMSNLTSVVIAPPSALTAHCTHTHTVLDGMVVPRSCSPF